VRCHGGRADVGLGVAVGIESGRVRFGGRERLGD
jgi:hypothetical protein